MKIVFIGTVEFSKITLQKLIDINAQVVGVCTKEKSSFNNDYADLTLLCQENNLPLKYVSDINAKENIEWINSLEPDIIFCFGWSSLIKQELLDLPPMGVVGYHPSKLPQNRGRHPFIWALVLGLNKSGSTFFFMDKETDSGDILSQKEINILDTDDAKILYDKTSALALKQIEEFLPQLQNNSYPKIIQDHTQSNMWRKRGSLDGKIDFRMCSKAIYNLVRALTRPYVGAHILYGNKEISVWKVKLLENKQGNIEPGKVIETRDNTFIVKTYDGAIEILEHDFTELPRKGVYL